MVETTLGSNSLTPLALLFALPFTHELTCRHSMQNLLHKDESHQCATLKEQQLREIFRTLGSVIVAYSGGVDSSYVAYVATAELGPRATCITGESASLPSYQRGEMERAVREFGFHHEIVQTEELENPNYQANNADRC